MSEPVPRLDDVEPAYQALIALYARTPDFREAAVKLPESYRSRSVQEDLRLVAEADADQIPTSARLAVLYELAKAGYPGREENEEARNAYRELADSAVRFRARRDGDPEVVGDDLLAEIQAAADERAPLSSRPRLLAGQNFQHSELAFTGRAACTIERVLVDGIEANWIYSEFLTDAPLARIADFLDPRRWPDLGPLFFKRMELVGSVQPLPLTPPPPGDPHWHGVFLEEVQLVRRLRTTLDCTYWRDATTAATTYDLASSLDRQIDVDRGYLLVTPAGAMNRVQVLKIVSFTDDFWDTVALFVCPFWTDWIRGAVRDATRTETTDPTDTPGAGRSPLGRAVEDWIDWFGRAAQPYLDLCTDATSRMRSGPYTSGDAMADGARWWSQFAKDWARAWTNWSDTVTEVAEHGLDAGVTPPDVPSERGRGSVSAFVAPAARAGGAVLTAPAGLAADEVPTASALVSIGDGAATIPPSEVSVTVEPGGRLRIRTTSASAPHGMYVGRLRTVAEQDLAPVALYVSRATKA